LFRSRPWFKRFVVACEIREEISEGIPFVGEDTGHVFPENDAGTLASLAALVVDFIGKFHKFQSKLTALVPEALSAPGERVGLAGCSPAQHVGGFRFAASNQVREDGHIPPVYDCLAPLNACGALLRLFGQTKARLSCPQAVRQDCGCRHVYLRKPCGLPP
jgi:hypothetical protein